MVDPNSPKSSRTDNDTDSRSEAPGLAPVSPVPVSPVPVSWIILTMGDRPEAVAAAVRGLLAHKPAPREIVLVGNGCAVDAAEFNASQSDLADTTRLVTVSLEANVGIPAGRNAGADAATQEFIAFLDDDAEAADPTITGRIIELLGVARPDSDSADGPRSARNCTRGRGIGGLSFRIVDPVSGVTQQRHVPTVGGRNPGRARLVTTFLGGASAFRRAAFHDCGGLPDAFFYAHEETDLAWRMLDAGWSIRYSPEIQVTHPATTPGRHAKGAQLTARNRVWLARRNLPVLLIPMYIGVWTALTVLRRSAPLRPFFKGLAEGCKVPCPPRRPMRWATVWTMTRLGRPPII